MTTVFHIRSSVRSAGPLSEGLAVGEEAVNTALSGGRSAIESLIAA